jgi:4-methyl-5(b-hydroxyethyl)-thiazole monophosphate biosynthesis
MNRNTTTYDLHEGMRRKQLSDFGVVIKNERIVVDKNITTSTGPSTGLDIVFTLLDMLTNSEKVKLVEKYLRFKKGEKWPEYIIYNPCA